MPFLRLSSVSPWPMPLFCAPLSPLPPAAARACGVYGLRLWTHRRLVHDMEGGSPIPGASFRLLAFSGDSRAIAWEWTTGPEDRCDGGVRWVQRADEKLEKGQRPASLMSPLPTPAGSNPSLEVETQARA